MTFLDRLFQGHDHVWEEYKQVKMEVYKQGLGPRWGEVPSVYFVSFCKCTICGEPRNFKLKC